MEASFFSLSWSKEGTLQKEPFPRRVVASPTLPWHQLLGMAKKVREGKHGKTVGKMNSNYSTCIKDFNVFTFIWLWRYICFITNLILGYWWILALVWFVSPTKPSQLAKFNFRNSAHAFTDCPIGRLAQELCVRECQPVQVQPQFEQNFSCSIFFRRFDSRNLPSANSYFRKWSSSEGLTTGCPVWTGGLQVLVPDGDIHILQVSNLTPKSAPKRLTTSVLQLLLFAELAKLRPSLWLMPIRVAARRNCSFWTSMNCNSKAFWVNRTS